MAFNEPLTTDQYNLLRSGRYAGQVNVSFFSQRVVFAGQVSGNLPSPFPWYQFNYDNVTVGSYTDVMDGMTLIIGSTNDLKYSALQERLFHGRIRLIPTSSVITCNITNAPVSDDYYFWVLDEFEILNRLSRPVGTVPAIVQYKDTTLAYQDMLPRVTGLQTCYAGTPDPITGKFRMNLHITAKVEQAGETITAYLYSFRSGIATVISGSLSSPTVTVDIDPAACAEWGETWGTLLVTQSDGVFIERQFGIKIHDADHPPNVSFDNLQNAAAWTQNYTATLPAFAGVDDILPGTPAVLWRSDEVYGNTYGGLTDNNIEFIGWFVSENGNIKGDKTYSTTSDVTFSLAGVGARMAYLIQQLLMIINQSSPSVWDQIWFAVPRRSVWHVLTRHSTVATLCDLDFDTELLTEDFELPAIPFKGNNVLDICNNLLAQVNGALEFAPDGRIFGCRDAQYLTDAEFAALPVIANFTAGVGAISDGVAVNHTVSYDNTIGRVDMTGASQNGSTVQAYKAYITFGEAQGSANLTDQILKNGNPVESQLEVCQRCGTYFAVQNFVEELTIDHPDGYDFLIPSKSELYTWTIDSTVVGTNGVNRIVFDTSTFWFVKSVSYQTANDGTRKVRVVYRRVVLDAPAGLVPPASPDVANTVPPLAPIPFPSLPTLPPFPEEGLPVLPPGFKPAVGKITHLDGNTVMASDDTNAWITQNYAALAAPTWIGITPSDLGSFVIRDAIFDPLGPSSNTCGGYILAEDGTDSVLYYAPNVLAHPPVWSKSATFSGAYTQIRGAGVAGSVEVYTSNPDGQTVTYDFTASQAGWSVNPARWPTGTLGWTAGLGFQGSTSGLSPTDHSYPLSCKITFPSTRHLLSCRVFTSGNFTTFFYPVLTFDSLTVNNFPQEGGLVDLGGTDSTTMEVWGATIQLPPGGPCWVSKVILTYGSSANANVRLISDYGATIGSALDLGSSPPVECGFDLANVTGVSYAAGVATVLKASTLGGSYSSLAASLGGNPTSIVIPYFQVGSDATSQRSSSTPQAVIGLDTEVSGTCLYIMSGTGSLTAITTPASGAIVDGPNKITMLRGKKIAVIVSVGGVCKLYVAENLTGAGTVTWTFIENVSGDAVLRVRRNDSSLGSHKGQIFIFDAPCGYTKTWANSGEKPRVAPGVSITAGDIYN